MIPQTNPRLSRKLLRLVMGDPELGQRIREARHAAGLTQKQLADAVGWADHQSVSNAERGISDVPAPRLRQIAQTTNKPITFFLDESVSPDEPRTLLLGEVLECVSLLAETSTEMLQTLESIDARLGRLEVVGADVANGARSRGTRRS